MLVRHFSYHTQKKKGRNNNITQLSKLQLHLVGFLKSLFPTLSTRAIALFILGK